MSYCRWSSMDFKCDLYCYEDVRGGWTTHVAGNKVVSPVISDAPIRLLLNGGWLGMRLYTWWHNLHMWTVGHGKRKPLGGPYAGASFNDSDLYAFKARLRMLRSAGYRFPDYVLQSVDDEIDEEHRLVCVPYATSCVPIHRESECRGLRRRAKVVTLT